MTWVRTDDGMPLHPKILRLSDGAYRLWSNALHFANRATTDGVIARDLVHTLDHRRAWTSRQIKGFIAEILAAGLWIETARGFEIHDYEHYQEEALKEVKEAKTAYETLRKRAYRAKKKAEKLQELGMCPSGTPPGHVPGTSPGQVVGQVVGQGTGQSLGQPAGQPVGQPAGQARDIDGGPHPPMSQPPGPARPGPARLSSLRSDMDRDRDLTLEGVIRVEFARFYEQAKATLWPKDQAKPEELRSIAAWAEETGAREGMDPASVIRKVVANFAADDFARSTRAPWAHFRKSYPDYWKPRRSDPKAAQPAGPAEGDLVV